MHQRLDIERMPDGRTVIELEFAGTKKGFERFRLMVTDGQVEVCIKHPGYEPDVQVSSDIRLFVECWRRIRSLRDEISAGRICVKGQPSLCRQFPDWLLLSALAGERLRAGKERHTYLGRSG